VRPGFPLPDLGFAPAARFWEAAQRRRLELPRCRACSQLCWYPGEACRHCGSPDLEWQALSGRGRLFSWTVVHHAFLPQFAAQLPLLPCLVALEEDPSARLVSRLVDCHPDQLEVDMALRVTWRTMSFPGVPGELTAPYFTPVPR